MNGALAVATAVGHGLFIGFLITGGPLSIRFRRFATPHLICVAGTVAVFMAGADCPLTTLEAHFRRAAGWPVPSNGFVSYYIVEPVHPAGMTLMIQLGMVAAWAVPTILGHGWRRRVSQRGCITLPDRA